MKVYTFIKACRKRAESVQKACSFNKPFSIKTLKRKASKRNDVHRQRHTCSSSLLCSFRNHRGNATVNRASV